MEPFIFVGLKQVKVYWMNYRKIEVIGQIEIHPNIRLPPVRFCRCT